MSHGRYSRDFADNIYHLQAEYDFNIKFSRAIIPSYNMQIPLYPLGDFNNLMTVQET